MAHEMQGTDLLEPVPSSTKDCEAAQMIELPQNRVIPSATKAPRKTGGISTTPSASRANSGLQTQQHRRK
ncbi:hypothetical protein KCU61_g571, partial [Aureobasidium melanogenum]